MSAADLRTAADIIEAFAAEMGAVIERFDKACHGMGNDLMSRINTVPHQDVLDEIVGGFEHLAEVLNSEACDAEEAEDRRRDNPLERDFRRLGQ
jgi:hypothetical protein